MKKFELISPVNHSILKGNVQINGGCANYACPTFNIVCPNVGCDGYVIDLGCDCKPIGNTYCGGGPSNPQCDISGRVGRPGSY